MVLTPAPPDSHQPVQVKSVSCPNCGASLSLRAFGSATTIVCEHCHSILDAKDPNLQILQKFQAKMAGDPPLIPLGTRGTLRGTKYEVIGFQRRSFQADGETYSWHEYVLFNPFKGFRYLSEYEGHWNDVSPMKSLPSVFSPAGPVVYLNESYRHFQTCKAGTTFVIGEFPWQVRIGETALCTDYVCPPRMLSSENYGGEVTWSMGEYISGSDIWKAFGLKGAPRAAVGVFENQPSPFSTSAKSVWKAFGLLAISLIVIAIGLAMSSHEETVLDHSYTFSAGAKGAEPSFVTEDFDLNGRTANVEVKTKSNVDNNWIYLNYTLINADTGDAIDFGREVSYYHGYDSDGSWSEGSQTDTAIIPSVQPGKYFLRVEPETDPNLHGDIQYSIQLRHGVTDLLLLLAALGLLLVPAVLITWRSMKFEHRRWAESDHAS